MIMMMHQSMIFGRKSRSCTIFHGIFHENWFVCQCLWIGRMDVCLHDRMHDTSHISYIIISLVRLLPIIHHMSIKEMFLIGR